MLTFYHLTGHGLELRHTTRVSELPEIKEPYSTKSISHIMLIGQDDFHDYKP
jgi:hypothetical protein